MKNWKIENAKNDLRNLQTVKNNIPEVLAPFKEKIQKLVGNSVLAQWIGTLAFGTGFAALAVFGPTMKRTKALTGLGRSLLVSSPAISGALPRIQLGGEIGRNGGRQWTVYFLVISIWGLFLNTYLAFNNIDELETMENFSSLYMWWLFGGLAAGFGIATFPMIYSVVFWSKRKNIGHNMAMFGGFGNLTAGVFSLLMTVVMNYTTLEIAYVLWLMLANVGTLMVIRLLPNSPYHQLMEQGIPHSINVKICSWLGQKILPDPNVTLKEVVKQWQAWVLVYIDFVSFGGFMALTVTLPMFIQEYHGASATTAGVFTASYSIIASLSRAATGKLVDKVGGGKCIICGLMSILFGSIIFALSPEMDPYTFYMIGGLFFLAFGAGFTNAAVYQWIPEVIRRGRSQTGGLISCIGAFGGFIIPQILGYVRDNFNKGAVRGFFAYTFLSVVGIGVTSYLIWHLEIEKQKRDTSIRI